MPQTIPALIERIADAASSQDDDRLLEMLEVLREHGATPRLQLLIAGSTGSGRASLANLILDRPGLIPPSPIPRAPISLMVRSGSGAEVTAISTDGMRTVLSTERLRSFLTSPTTPGRYTAAEVRDTAEILETCELRLEAIEADRSDSDWTDLLAGVDYLFLVLNATALLSDLERRFVKEHLSAGFGLHRVAIVVNQMDLIPEDERESILDLVRIFLGPFESQPAIVEMSALEAAGDTAEGGYDALMTLLDDLLERHGDIRAGTARRALASALSELEDSVRRQDALFALDESEAARMRETIASRRDWLHGRIERAQSRVDAFLNTIVKERLLREIEGFADAIRHRLSGEIRSIEDLTTVKKYLPGYMETIWKDFLHSQMIAVRVHLLDETRRIEELVEGDLAELVGDVGKSLRGRIRDLDSGTHAMHILVMPRRGKHHASGIAKSLGYFGLGTFVWNPPLGALSMGAGVLVRRIFKGGMEEADRSAVVAAALTASRDLERELKGRIEKQFKELIETVKADVEALYRQGIEDIERSLDERTSEREGFLARKEQLHTLIHITLPELRSMLNELGEPVPA
jgi:hypothetical protein